MIDKRDIRKWIFAKNKLNATKAEELRLRLLICDYILAGETKGSKKSIIGGFTLTATTKLNSKIDADLLNTIWKGLSEEEKACIKFAPSIIAKEYNKLKGVQVLDRAIDSKPGTPSLAIKPVLFDAIVIKSR